MKDLETSDGTLLTVTYLGISNEDPYGPVSVVVEQFDERHKALSSVGYSPDQAEELAKVLLEHATILRLREAAEKKS